MTRVDDTLDLSGSWTNASQNFLNPRMPEGCDHQLEPHQPPLLIHMSARSASSTTYGK